MVKVWDPFVRFFHWSLVTLFVIAYATGDEVEKVHVAAGYAIAGLLARLCAFRTRQSAEAAWKRGMYDDKFRSAVDEYRRWRRRRDLRQPEADLL